MHTTLHLHNFTKHWGQVLRRISGGIAAASVCLLAACGGGGSPSTTPSSTPAPSGLGTTPTAVVTTPTLTLTLSISGTAATGAPIGSATVSALCASGSGSASTNAKGEFTVTLAGTATLPCLLEIKKAQLVLHGIALQTGTANITPLTELQFALLAGSANRSAVFAAFASTATSAQASQYSASAVAAAWVKVKTKLLTLGLDGTATATLNAMANPNTTAFNAASGDAVDYVLDQVAVRLAAKGLTLDTLVGQLLNQIPLGSFSASAVGLTVTTNAAASSDPDGSVSAYGWKWSDGSADQTTSSPTATHVYASSGTFSINLVVLDALGGASSVVSQNITLLLPPVIPANNAPVANTSIANANGLLVAFDASASSDSDGAIASYAWNFGEPSSASNTATGVTSTHAYARAGNYTATLTLTDNQGSVTSKTSALTVSPPAAVATGKLNDTGITAAQCYTAGTDALSLCSSPAAIALSATQDGMTGRDANAATNSGLDGTLGFSFTKIGASGETLPNNATSWSCVKDNVTGLMWEVKTNDGGPRDWNKTYTNYDSTSSFQINATTKPTAAQINAGSNSIGFQNAVNVAGLCGATDWRLPTDRELQSLINNNVASPGPTIEAAWFPSTQGNAFWSSSPVLNSAGWAWLVYFNYGGIDYSLRSLTGSVRLVRTGQ